MAAWRIKKLRIYDHPVVFSEAFLLHKGKTPAHPRALSDDPERATWGIEVHAEAPPATLASNGKSHEVELEVDDDCLTGAVVNVPKEEMYWSKRDENCYDLVGTSPLGACGHSG
jgi:hypothetical protein